MFFNLNNAGKDLFYRTLVVTILLLSHFYSLAAPASAPGLIEVCPANKQAFTVNSEGSHIDIQFAGNKRAWLKSNYKSVLSFEEVPEGEGLYRLSVNQPVKVISAKYGVFSDCLQIKYSSKRKIQDGLTRQKNPYRRILADEDEVNPFSKLALASGKTLGAASKIKYNISGQRTTNLDSVFADKKAKYKIVIDAGHGGKDVGSIGKSLKLYEKTITLAYAKVLKMKLEASGSYKVVLTREKDKFMPLNERIDVARNAKPDLFLSLHADSIADRNFRGLGVYTLAEKASDRYTANLAKKENNADKAKIEPDANISALVHKMHARNTLNKSSEFANSLVKNIRDREVRSNIKVLSDAHRFGNFKILTMVNTPSVLIELGYLSNASEEKLLSNKKYQDKLTDEIVRSIEAFFKSM